MGNFSRDTFNPAKGYVGVRLQQGVPLVDADWNELNDVVRHELHESLRTVFTDGVVQYGADPALGIYTRGANDLYMEFGSAIIGGRRVEVEDGVRYSTQPWTDPDRAARDGVAVIPPLTTPTADRTDIAYVDVWDREVGRAEDPNLINPAIGIETCVRHKAEATLRVAEGTTTLPAAPARHRFMRLALLRRKANQANITQQMIEDARPLVRGPRTLQVASFVPAFWPLDTLPSWRIASQGSLKIHALKEYTSAAYGILPLVLPDGGRMMFLGVRGLTQGMVAITFLRARHQHGSNPSQLVDIVYQQTFQPFPGQVERSFDEVFALPYPDRKSVVDNSRYYYYLLAGASGTSYAAQIHGISIDVEYWGD